jgi:subtilisin family serine protease
MERCSIGHIEEDFTTLITSQRGIVSTEKGKGKDSRVKDMNKKMLSIIAIVTILMSTAAFMPISMSSSNTMQPNLSKLAPNLRAEIEANPTGDYRIEVVLKPGIDKALAVNSVTSLGGDINAEHNIINAISATLSADKIPMLTSLAFVDKILVDGKKYMPPTPLGDDSGSWPIPGPDPEAIYAQFPFWMGADKAWDMGITGTGVVVAVLDTGLNYEHPDLAGVVVNPATDYAIFTGEANPPNHDGGLHGTACAGLVASQGNTAYYGFFKVLGVANGAKLIGGKVLTDYGWGWDSWIINGIDWAVAKGANIITMSLGGLEVPNDGYDPTCLALEAATKKGVTCFIAAGNDQGAGTSQSPGVAHDVITVGASTENSGPFYLYGYWPVNPGKVLGYENDQMIFWSGAGATADGRVDPDVCAIGAWGETIYADDYENAWLQFGGTSMATPVAAGVGALVLQAYKQAHGAFPSPAVVRKILMNTAKDIGYPANRQGAGRVDAEKAVEAALSMVPYSTTDEMNTGIIPAGLSYKTSSFFTSNIDNAYATTLQPYGSISYDGLTITGPGSGNTNGGSTWLPITIPAGVDFADVRVKFAPEVAYGTPIRLYDGTTWTDVHINTALYKERTEGDPNDLILINYAYAHTNVQWFDARIDFGPGTYVLRFWNAYPTVSPVDVQINFYKFVPWNWVATTITGTKLATAISVPTGTAPGTYSGFIKGTCNGSPFTIPIVTTVPAKLGKTFTVQTNVMNEPRTFASGDWLYIPVQAFTIGNLMLKATWTTPDADFDVYLINPMLDCVAESVAPHVPAYHTGGGGAIWYTTTGTTMEVLSTFSLFPGYWYVGIHAMYFGNTFGQTVTLKLDQSKAINTPAVLDLKKGTSKTFTVSNNIPGTVNVQTMALQLTTERYAWTPITGTITSFDGTNPGYDGWYLIVTPDMITMTVTLNWAGGLQMSLSLWDPAGRNVAVTDMNGGSITVNAPAIGAWTAIITINEPGTQGYTLNVRGLRFKAFSDVTIAPATFTLAPSGTQQVTISAASTAKGIGVIVYYDLGTLASPVGSEYARTLFAIKP